MQGIHRLAARRAGGGATVPVLVTPDGVLGESGGDPRLGRSSASPPERRLFPAEPSARAEVERLCRRFDDELGPRGRRLMYVHMLAQPDADAALQQRRRAALGGSRHPPRLAGRRALRPAPAEHPPGVESGDEAAVWREFDFVAELLADGRPYLCGDRFGAADLTFAALSARGRRPARLRRRAAAARTSCRRTPRRSSSARASIPPDASRFHFSLRDSP